MFTLVILITMAYQSHAGYAPTTLNVPIYSNNITVCEKAGQKIREDFSHDEKVRAVLFSCVVDKQG